MIKIPTWTETEVLAYCSEVASNSNLMVEFGTYLGASAAAMLEANDHLHLWCVDTFNAFAFHQQVAEHYLEKWIHNGACELIVGDSERGLEMLSHMLNRIDAIWVDDGHAVEDVRRDILCGLKLLRPGGILFGHDWDGDNDVATGVRQSLPVESLTFPLPRVWQFIKP